MRDIDGDLTPRQYDQFPGCRGKAETVLQRQVKRIVRLTVGSILLVIGFIGGFIPILQGWVFVLAGLTVMAPESKTASRFLERVKARVKRPRG